jgi:hypothetical protein
MGSSEARSFTGQTQAIHSKTLPARCMCHPAKNAIAPPEKALRWILRKTARRAAGSKRATYGVVRRAGRMPTLEDIARSFV